ncbi:hypothetical protein RCL1_003878 [Eukaryota sp. TZLM3-RCL]
MDGDELYLRAEARLTKWFSFGTTKFEEASEIFVRAANAYKLRKEWKKAGDSFSRASECMKKCEGQEFEVGNHLASAATCYKKVDPSIAVTFYKSASDTFASAGRFQTAAKHLKDAAESMKSDGEKQSAVELFLEASNLFESEEQSSSSHACQISAADLSAELGNYVDAAKIYESIGLSVLDDRLRKFSAREHFLKCILCFLASTDNVAAKDALSKFNKSDSSFEQTREADLCKSLVEAVEEGDVEQLATAIYEYDSISKLDDWKTAVCLKIRENIESQGVV